MTPHDYIYLGTLIATIWYLRRDMNGLGRLARSIDSKQERRWKHLVAMLVEMAETDRQRERISKLLREDAWRD